MIELLNRIFQSLTTRVLGREIGESMVKDISSRVIKNRTAMDTLLGRLISPELAKKYPHFPLFFRNIKNVSSDAFINTLASYERNIGSIPADAKWEGFEVLRLLDVYRRSGMEGKPHSLKIEPEIALERLKIAIPSLSSEGKQFLLAFKRLSDEIAENKILGFNEQKILAFEESLLESSLRPREEVQEILNYLNTYVRGPYDKEWRLWNFYFPHISLEQWGDLLNSEHLQMVNPKLAKKFKAFFQHASKGGEYALLQEPELLYQVLKYQSELATGYYKYGTELLEKYDILKKLNVQEKENLLSNPNVRVLGFEKPFSVDYLPERIASELKARGIDKVEFWDANSFFRRRIGNKDAENILNLLQEYLPPEEGFAQRFYLIPAELGQMIKNLEREMYATTPEFIAKIRTPVRLWKSWVTVYGRMLPFSIANAIGDVFNQFYFHPSSIKQLPRAVRIAWRIAYEGKMPEGIKTGLSPEEFLERLRKHGILETLLTSEVGTSRDITLKASWDRLKNALFHEFSPSEIVESLKNTIISLNKVREMTPKISSILDNLQRVTNGKPPVFDGAREYILELAKNNEILPAIFEYGNFVTVDYSLMSPTWRRYFADFLMPFGFWYMNVVDNITRFALTPTGIKRTLLMFGIPITAIYLWNNRSKEMSRIYDSLPPFYKYGSLSIIVGIDKKTGNPIIFRVQPPIFVVADMWGITHIVKVLDSFQKGELTAEDAAKSLIFGTPLAVSKEISNLLNPIIQSFISVQANRDLFTGKQIVPERLRGTPYENELKIRYLTNNIFLSPILPSLMAKDYDDIYQILIDYGVKNPEGYARILTELIEGMGKSMFSLKRVFFPASLEEPGAFMLWAKNQDLQANKILEEKIAEKLKRAMVSGDLNAIRQEFLKAQENAYKLDRYYPSPARLLEIMDRPSFRIDVLERKINKIKDKELRDKLLKALNQLKAEQAIKERSIKEWRPYLDERWELLKKSLNMENE